MLYTYNYALLITQPKVWSILELYDDCSELYSNINVIPHYT